LYVKIKKFVVMPTTGESWSGIVTVCLVKLPEPRLGGLMLPLNLGFSRSIILSEDKPEIHVNEDSISLLQLSSSPELALQCCSLWCQTELRGHWNAVVYFKNCL